jgi:hypothetical protein
MTALKNTASPPFFDSLSFFFSPSHSFLHSKLPGGKPISLTDRKECRLESIATPYHSLLLGARSPQTRVAEIHHSAGEADNCEKTMKLQCPLQAKQERM